MLNTNPLVSVIIPTYNREKRISKAIESVINQSYQEWELIIIDDRSIDSTASILEDYSKKDSRITYHENRRKQGPSGARNSGMEKASGKYIAFLDSDDIWFPNHLEDCVVALEKENAKISWGLWSLEINDVRSEGYAGQFFLNIVVKDLKPGIGENYFVFNHHLLEYLLLRKYYMLNTSTFVFRRDELARTGFFDEALLGGEDSDLFFRLMINSKICIVNSIHAVYIQGDDNLFYFKEKYDFSNPVSCTKHKQHKTFEIMHYEKVLDLIMDEQSFVFKGAMQKTVYKTLSDKYSFLAEVLENLTEGEKSEKCKIKSLHYQQKSDSITSDAKTYFYLAYSSRYNQESYCFSINEINQVDLKLANYWLIIEDYNVMLHTNEGVILYNATTAEKLLVPTNLLAVIEQEKCLLGKEQLEDKNLVDSLNTAIKKNMIRVLKVIDKTKVIDIFSPENLFFKGEIAKGYRRDPELLGMIKTHKEIREMA